MYDLSLKALREVARALRDHVTLDAVYTARDAYTAVLEPEFRALSQPGDDGVAAIDIIESTALLLQKRLHTPDLGPQSFENTLQVLADASYRHAYDVATEVLQEDAFDQLPHVATLALQTTDPQTVFLPLLEAFRREGSRTDIAHNHRVGLTVLNRRFQPLLLGHPLEMVGRGFSEHPILFGVIRQYNDLALEGQIEPLVLMARPHALSEHVANLLVGPMSFPPTSPDEAAGMYLPEVWRDRVGTDPLFRPENLRLLSAASSLIVMDLQPPPPRLPANRGHAANYDMPVVMRSWVFSRENRTEATADQFATVIREIEGDPAKVRLLRGTAAVTFPDEEHTGSPYADAEVRRFVRGLYDRVPHLLFYLSESTAAGSMLGCAAAHAPPDAVSEAANGDIGVRLDERTVPHLAARARAAASFARQMGVEPTTMLGHFRPLEPDLREALTAVVLGTDPL